MYNPVYLFKKPPLAFYFCANLTGDEAAVPCRITFPLDSLHEPYRQSHIKQNETRLRYG